MHTKSFLALLVAVLAGISDLSGQGSEYLRTHYAKEEVYIPMRDGIRLFTAIYSPRDTSRAYPILFVKTPYGLKNYGNDNYPEDIGPSEYLARDKYIIVYQEARGTFLSEGSMRQMDPHLPEKPDSTYTDNSSDTYDAVEWLVGHTNNNGRVGLWGISYRGFYALSGIIDAHPAIVCSSPQAPIADWYSGDDMHHNGAFALLGSFLFFESVGIARDSLTTGWPEYKTYPTRDAYGFFLNCGTISELDDRYFPGENSFWDSIMVHPDFDAFWQRRNILPHLTGIRPAVLITAGLFDQENLYGSIMAYRKLKAEKANVSLALGPWIHGGWARTSGDSLGPVHFGAPTSDFYQREIEFPFFTHYLKGADKADLPPQPAVFETGTNRWTFPNEWPAVSTSPLSLYLGADFSLSQKLPSEDEKPYDEYVSDPAHPVPYTAVFHPTPLFYNKEYMTEDQRFASARPDVLTYCSEVLEDTLSLGGPVMAELFAECSGSDLDLIVKIIDVYPDSYSKDYPKYTTTDMAGYQQLVRAEILRGRYRNSPEHPEAVVPGKIEKYTLALNDISHAFLPGHRIMVQVQSSWFPLFDRNPQTYTDIYHAGKDAYVPASVRIYHSEEYPSHIEFTAAP